MKKRADSITHKLKRFLYGRARAVGASSSLKPTTGSSPLEPTIGSLYSYCSIFDAKALIRSFTPTKVFPTDGIITNFLGVKVSPQVVPSFVGHLAGHVEGPPEPGNWHACIAEWAAALRSVEQAEETYQIIELGCGWGCWLNNMGVVAVRKGLRVQLVGVEGNRRHVDDAEATLALNGFNKGDWRIVNGIAAAKHGTAFFPIVEHHAEVWGSQAIFFPEENEAQALRSAGKYSELRCIKLADISGGAITDLLHIDIQGAEVDFVVGNIEEMRRSVKRCLIGTHSREIDGMLFAKFLEAGWKLEVERPAIHEIVDGHPEIRIDGVQLWRNPALTH